jgi:hypothetical protein
MRAERASPHRALLLVGLVGLGTGLAFAPSQAAASSPPSLRTVVQRGYAQLDRDTSKLAVIMAHPIVAGGSAQAKAAGAVNRMQADLTSMATQVARAGGGSAAGVFELQAISQLRAALTIFQSALAAKTSAAAIPLTQPMLAQLAAAKASMKHAAQLLGCPTTC